MAKKRFLWCTVLMIVLAACLGLAACSDKPETSEPQTGSKAGEYYYETESGEEYLLALNEDGSASFSADTELTGSYTVSDEALTITFGQDGADDLVINASYKNGTITLTYQGTEMQFLEKVYYTVTFETNGGTEIGSVQVLNGKTVAEPEEEPGRTNYAFLGWYKDSAGNEPFDFTIEKITANTTIYAKWEYINTIAYDSENGVSGSITVKEGDSYSLPVPDAEYGYIFIGWHTESGDRLTDADGESLAAWNPSEYGNITVYARFEADLTYTLTEDGAGYIAEGKTESADLENLIIPASHEGKPVVEVGSFAGYSKVSRVSLPDSVTSLNVTGFSDSKLLTSYEIYDAGAAAPVFTSADGVVFSADMTTLVLYPVAKSGDGDTTTYTIPVSVTEIGDYAFCDIRYTEAGDEWTPLYAGTLQEVIFPQGLKKIGDHAFYQRGKLSSATFGGMQSTQEWSVGPYAFYGNILSEFDFNDNLTSIGDYAFYSDYANHSQLSEVVFTGNSKLESIGVSAFYFTRALRKVVLPPSLTDLGESAFFNCNGATTLEFLSGSKLSKIENNTFAQWAFTEVVIPDSVTEIGEYAFGYSSLQKVILSENLISIGAEAFLSCEELEEITMPSSLKTIGADAFSGCTALKKVVLNDGLETIGDNAFITEEYDEYTQELTINIPSSVTAMGKGMLASQKPIAELKVDNAAFLSAASESDWFDSVNVLLLAEGLSLPAAQSDDFVLVEDAAEEGYAFYVNRNVKVRTQTYLDEIASQAWISQIDTLLIEENLTVPQSISGTFTKGDALVEEWYCNYVKYLKTTV